MRATLAALVGFLIGAIFSPPTLAVEPQTRAGARSAAASQASHVSSTPGSLQPGANDASQTEIAVFAGGCFWCTELAFEQLRGVMDVESGYCGGTRATASYDRVHQGSTGHAEAIRVTYDPAKIGYEQLLSVFFDAHDPTQFNRQGEDDVGRQYRSAIFFANDAQKKEAEAKIKQLQQKRVYARHIVTRLEPLTAFYPAEDMHQNFARKYPLLPYIQTHAIPRACDIRLKHPELIDPRR